MSDIRDNQIYLLREDIACVHTYLDDLKLPRSDDKGEIYSIIGRIKQLEFRFQKEKSELESHYLVNG